LKGMKEKGRAFKGILFVGLMIDKEIPNVIEFNCRFGDPETQVLMPMLEGPLGELFLSASKGNIDKNISSKVKVSTEKSAVHIVLASEGYPGLNGTKLTTGQTILEATESPEGIHVFYAGVEESIGNTLVNSGGRVLGITGIGADVKEARDMAYKFLPSVLFNGAQWRNDIALKERL
jgi:phosphoribosylamine--glycine ligase